MLTLQSKIEIFFPISGTPEIILPMIFMEFSISATQKKFSFCLENSSIFPSPEDFLQDTRVKQVLQISDGGQTIFLHLEHSET